MSLALFDLDEFEETRPVEWVIVGDWDYCGLCGTRTRSMNQGGTDTGNVCDACARIDRCSIHPHAVVYEERPSRYRRDELEVAWCEHCLWSLDAERFEDGEWVPLTPEQIAAAGAEHERPRHVSHWGVPHEIDEHDGLIAAQAKRRAAYLRRAAA